MSVRFLTEEDLLKIQNELPAEIGKAILEAVESGQIEILPSISDSDNGKVLSVVDGKPTWVYRGTSGDGSTTIEVDGHTLIFKNGLLMVNTANEVSQDNTLPITSAAVHTTVGNIEVLLKTI